MSELKTLPLGWELIRFQDLFISPQSEIVDGPFGSNLKASEYTDTGIPLARLQNITRGRFVTKNMRFVSEGKADDLARHNFVAGDILISKLGDPLGEACLAPESIARGVLVADVVRARITHKWLSSRFLTHQINSGYVIEQFKNLTKGTTRPRVNLTKIRDLNIYLCPRDEQTRIVEKLEELLSDLDNGVAELKTAQTKLTQYRQSLLKSAVEGSLTAEWRKQNPVTETGEQLLQRILIERRQRWEQQKLAEFKEKGKTPPKDWQKKYPEPVQPDTSELPELPDGWVWASVVSTGDVQLGRQRAPKYHFGENMVPYLRVANVFEGRIDTTDVKSMHFSESDEESYLLNCGDILLNEGQSLELIGRPAIYRNELERVCFTNTLVRYRPSDCVYNEYALLVFRYYMHSGRFQKTAKITTNIAHLGAGRFAEIEIPVPPKAEQVQIFSLFENLSNKLERQLAEVSESLKRTEAQRKNILKDAFSGKLVAQNPKDEPASVLLEKIKAERAAQNKQQPTRRKKKAAVA